MSTRILDPKDVGVGGAEDEVREWVEKDEPNGNSATGLTSPFSQSQRSGLGAEPSLKL